MTCSALEAMKSLHNWNVVQAILTLSTFSLAFAMLSTREEVSFEFVRESYGQYHVTIIHPEDTLEDEALSGLLTVSRNSKDPLQTIVDLTTGTGPYILEGVILVMLPQLGGNFRDSTDRVIQDIVALKTFIDRFRLIINIHSLDNPTQEELVWLQAKHRPSLLLSVISTKRNDHSEFFLSEYNSQNVRIRCSTLDFGKCPGGPIVGSMIRVAYDFWYPLTFQDDNGQIGGFYQDVLLIIANRLNLTLEMIYNQNPGAWGKRLENGTWNGLLGMLESGKADVASSALTRSPQRIESFDFSLSVSYMEVKLYTKKPDGARISIQNYFWEFDRYIWMSIFITALAIIICMTIILITSSQTSSLSQSSAAVLKALINRGVTPSLAKSTKISFKVLLLVLFSFTIVLNISYKSCLNAFLAVAIPIERIHNLDDVLEKSTGISMWPGGGIEDTLATEKEGSTARKLYEKFKSDSKASMESYDQGLKNVIENDYVMVGEAETITVLDSYTCDVLQVKDYHYMRSQLAMAFEKGSRFREAFDREILNMKLTGVIDRLSEVYIGRNKRIDAECESNSAIALGFTNVFTPFSLILLGASVGIIILILETLYFAILPKNDLNSKIFSHCESECVKKLDATERIMRLDQISNYQKIQLLQQLFLSTWQENEKEVYPT